MIEQWLPPHRTEIVPGFHVGRVLPFKGGKGVGPFVFLDHMGPHTFPAGTGIDVAPHPHIGLSTVTYLFSGELEHRDSLGTIQTIRPGDVNWMTAGRGIVHSERSPQSLRSAPQEVHGLQAWVALPVEFEEVKPSFEHCESARLPIETDPGVKLKLVAGDALGLHSPVKHFSRLFYLHAQLEDSRDLDFDPDGQEVAYYLVSGTVTVEGQDFTGPGLILFKRGSAVRIRSKGNTEGVLLGGDPLPEHRRIWWNFVSSRPERIEEAKRQWRAQEFDPVPGESTFVPLPE